MDIVIHALGMPFDGNTIKERSLGGSESAAYYQARELAKLGHRVHLFTGCQHMMESDKVRYVPVGNVTQEHPLGDQFDHYAQHTPIDVLIIQRHPLAFHKQYNSRINIWQLHDLALHRTAGTVQHMTHNITAVTVVSEWHKEQVCKVYGLNPERVFVIRNGVDPALYEGDAEDIKYIKLKDDRKLSDLIRKDGFNMLYQSRPERGLEHLVRPGGIMDRLRDTTAHLLICGYDNTVDKMRAYYEQLGRWASALPNVTYLGALTKPQLATLQKNCDLLCYPTEFEEVSCITAMEAMHAGLPMLTSDCAALKETCEGAGVELIKLKDGHADEDAFYNSIEYRAANKVNSEDAYGQEADDFHGLMRPGWLFHAGKQREAAKRNTWAKVGESLELLIKTLASEHLTVANQLRESIEHSDIDAADLLLSQCEKGDAIVEAARFEIDTNFDFRKSHDKLVAHYKSHQTDYYNQGSHVGEDVTQTMRYQGTLQVVGSALSREPGKRYRVLDYGCAHGSFLAPFAKMFPHCEFVGMDISPLALKSAQEWIDRDNLTNASVIQGDHESFADPAFRERLGKFDVVFAGEVLEHVPNDTELLNDLAMLLPDGGTLCITTPSGRWEWSGVGHNLSFYSSREHIHHYNRTEIAEICQAHKGVNILYAPAGPECAGGALGWWVWGIDIDKDAKFVPKTVKPRIPRQTLSACLIVKDGETTIKKCIESFIRVADEIVIAIDPKTTDRTREILDQIKAEWPIKPIKVIDGLSALEAGFDEARNLTVKEACGDWIMWCDADEEVKNPWNLWRYLRPSLINGVGFPQVHYSTEPDKVLTVDYPCRLFRNNGVNKFYGVVHEHPETVLGTGVTFSTLRGDVKFLHNGYVDEAVRRERFRRNLPLLARDREKYPNRNLGRFLQLRDIAQGIHFELEQTHGHILHDHPARARQGIELWREILEKDPTKMIIDALQYYSMCVQVLQGGFNSKVSFNTNTEVAPDLAVNVNFEGRFDNADDLQNLFTKLQKEATSRYGEKYL